jgi:phosphatidate cytidylyltransferase
MLTIIKRIITGFILTISFLLLFIYLPPYVLSFMLGSILLYIIIFEWPHLFNPKRLPFWLLMPFYPVLPFIFLILMNQNLLYRPLLFILFVLVALYDTGSYFVGSLIGYHKIVPRISPAKTWEGVIGGYFFVAIGLSLILWVSEISLSYLSIVFFSLIVSIFSSLGDLFESWLKRRVNIKDSGFILPGHGGFLDRLDGVLFAAFFFYLCKDYLLVLFNLK